MKRIVFLVSGSGATLKFINYCFKENNVDVKIVGIIADRDVQNSIHNFAVTENIYFKEVQYSRNSPLDMQLELKHLSPDIIVTTFHKILDKETLSQYSGKFINLHYSLLPAFAGMIGMKTIEYAMKQNVQFLGGTCHEVTENVDEGRILYQGIFPVINWSEDSLKGKIDTVFKLCCLLLLSAIFDKVGFSKGKVDKLQINGHTVIFSPSLPINSLNYNFDSFKKYYDTFQ